MEHPQVRRVIGVQDVAEETNDLEEVTGFRCAYWTEHNDLEEVVVPAFYELLFQCAEGEADIRKTIESRLMTRAAKEWKIIPGGETCDGVGIFIEDTGLLGVSSEPKDELTDRRCTRLVVEEGTCCTVVHSQMTFTPYPAYVEEDLWAWVSAQLNDTLTEEGEDFSTVYIGSQLESDTVVADGTEVVPDYTDPGASSVVRGADSGLADKKFTTVGGLIFGAMVVALVVSVGLVIVLRKKHRNRPRQVKEDVRNIHDDFLSTDSDNDDPNIQVTVLSDVNRASKRENTRSFQNETASTPWSYNDQESDAEADDERDEFAGKVAQGDPRYNFDLGGSFREHVMGAHAGAYGSPTRAPGSPQSISQLSSSPSGRASGPTSIAVVPPYPMEETSDSEADSWAQTDGTVGSLDEHLEVITAEI